MKKILKFLVFVIAFIIAIPSTVGAVAVADASTVTAVVSKSTFSETVNEIINDYSVFKNRLAGSNGEKQASEYIKGYLNNVYTVFCVGVFF